MKPFTRDTAVKHLGRTIKRVDTPFLIEAPLFGVTDEGFFLGTMECGPFIHYAWAVQHCVFCDTLEPVGEPE